MELGVSIEGAERVVPPVLNPLSVSIMCRTSRSMLIGTPNF
jgi:hypothetical protein